ncbi:hypothetical protein ATE84_2986 [Aquimarina sp. MAR_2010_214]|uniref:hypothetical protein n=1 Tax=Aquimarina sp. MAR_2010_214 TaxID=1250026 RepID=UPI000C70440F|nr:hypothetical protein [Aquimarina sp. MAR_2010_214]PKV50917.1 hypothetical protein ATE84_2986 [Aquimarina sp. MAR_2010_214]
MKKAELESKILDATSSLIDIATDICWNKISRNCEYIMSEIDENIWGNYFERAKIRKKVNNKKPPKSLNGIVAELTAIYENLYDINLYIYKSLSDKTIIEIRYFLKTSHTAEFYPTIINNEPMLHCKVARPSYIAKSPNSTKLEKKFDVNWELGGIRHEFNKFLGKIRYRIWKYEHEHKQKLYREGK